MPPAPEPPRVIADAANATDAAIVSFDEMIAASPSTSRRARCAVRCHTIAASDSGRNATAR